MKNRIKVAFVNFGGMSAGGSQKLLQIIAANLAKDEFEVDYYYCDTAPYIGAEVQVPGTDPDRLRYMQSAGINLIEFKVKAKDVTVPTHRWIGTDFWEKFDESKYDIIQTCRAGHKEYPFTKIRKKPIVDIIALSSGCDNQYNISRVMHICQWSADGWVRRGGDARRVALISLPIEPPRAVDYSLKKLLSLEGKFVYGFHQRLDDGIFSEIPLNAYSKVESNGTAFVLLGGSKKYQEQAQALGIKNITFLPVTGNQEEIYKFLATLDVYAHGRKDGEVNSQAMGEAMFFGLPILSHYSAINNGHVECIGSAGLVVNTEDEYARELLKLRENNEYYTYRRNQSKQRFEDKYELNGQIANIVSIYKDVVINPYPHRFRRMVTSLHYTQNVRVWFVALYLFLKYRVGFKFLKRG